MKQTFKRYRNNPVITPAHLKPLFKNGKILGTFNPGVTHLNDEIILLIRVSETINADENSINVYYYHEVDEMTESHIINIKKDDPKLHIDDRRVITYRGKKYLTSLSYFVLARSKDGINFKIEKEPFITPQTSYELYGVEDARISKIDGVFYITYTAVSGDGIVTGLISTKDFKEVGREGIIFPPDNKDVVLFEERINNKYIALHRPSNRDFGRSSVWYAESPDLIHWGNHNCLLRPEDSLWNNVKTGASAVPIKTKEGWLVLYHGVGTNRHYNDEVYSLSLLLLDLNDPSKVIAKSKDPVMIPETEYERKGFVNNVIFSDGMIVRENGDFLLYYGACDEKICLARSSITLLLSALD